MAKTYATMKSISMTVVSLFVPSYLEYQRAINGVDKTQPMMKIITLLYVKNSVAL